MMKKTSTLFAALFAVTSLYAARDIYEIRPCYANGESRLNGDKQNAPYTVRSMPITTAGEDIYFNVRLASRSDDDDGNETFSIVRRDGVPMSSTQWELSWNPPQIGIFVGGRPDVAEMVSPPTRTPVSYSGTAKNQYLWDMVFHYRVKSGDLGLPIKLALQSPDSPDGVPYPEEYEEGTLKPTDNEYLLKNRSFWKIQYKYKDPSKDLSEAGLCFWPEQDYSVRSFTDKPETDTLYQNRSLADCGFWTETVNFAETAKELSVSKGHTSTARIALKNEVTATSASEMYVWAVDKDWYDIAVTEGTPTEASWNPNPAVIVDDGTPVEIALDATTTPAKGTIYRKKVSLAQGASGVNFKIRGNAYDPTLPSTGDGNRVVLILSSSGTFTWKKGVGVVAEDFLTTTAVSTESVPELSLKLSPGAITVDSDYKTPKATLTVTLSDDYEWPTTETPRDITVTITPKVSIPAGSTATPPYKWSQLVHLGADASQYSLTDPIKVTFENGKAGEYEVAVFGIGAPSWEQWHYDQDGTRLEFEVAYDYAPAEGHYRKSFDMLYLTPAAPKLKGVEDEYLIDGVTREPVDIAVEDNYTDVNDRTVGGQVTGYTVKLQWWKTLAGKTKPVVDEAQVLTTADGKYSLFAPDNTGKLYAIKADGTFAGYSAAFQPSLPAEVTPGFYNDGLAHADIWLVAPNLEKSATTATKVSVYEKPTAVAYTYATSQATTPTSEFNEITENVDSKQALAYIGLTLSEAATSDMYAYLAPTDPEMLKYISGDCLTNSTTAGIKIPKTYKTVPNSNRKAIKLLDGTASTTISFDVYLCKTPRFSLDPSNLIKTYNCSMDSDLIILNVEPRVTNDFKMSGWSVVPREDGSKWFESPVSAQSSQVFSFNNNGAFDAEKDLKADKVDVAKGVDERFYTKISIKESGKAEVSYEYRGDPRNGGFLVTNVFTKVGTAQVTVRMQDKDMRAEDSGRFFRETYNVEVVNQPSVSIAWVKDRTATYAMLNEGAKDTFIVRLSEAPSEDITVDLTVTQRGTGKLTFKEDTGVCAKKSEGVYTITFKKDSTEVGVSVDETDGTQNSTFGLKAAVSGDQKKPGEDVKWSDYYLPSSTFDVDVSNLPPTLTVMGRTFKVTNLDQTEFSINSSNDPVKVSIGNGDPIPWSVNDVLADLGKAGESVSITVHMTDDKGTVTENIHDTTTHYMTPRFTDAGTKVIRITASDKDQGSITVMRWYTVQASKTLYVWPVGPGAGDGNELTGYYRGKGLGKGHIYVNNRTPIDGNRFRFTFNCGTETYVDAIAQGYRKGDVDDGSLTKNGGKDFPINPDGGITIEDPTAGPFYLYDDTHDSFFYCWILTQLGLDGTKTSALIGVPSPEVTDARQTTVPLSTEQNEQNGTFQPTTLEAIFSREWHETDNIGDLNSDAIPDVYALGYKDFGAVAADKTDMKDLSGFNDDGDYLPWGLDQVQTSFIFMPTNSWAKPSLKFTAKLEIRGYDDHLNDASKYAPGNIETYEADRDPATTFSALEYEAYLQAGSPEGWTPECPSDPTKYDTDEDGLPDGYEYYIWYKAHVGWIANGVHHYLTGRKYNPANPHDPIEISSREIADAYNPRVYHADFSTTDTDDDGLTDFVEFALGTNPFDYDTDGDGLPDGYEVAFTGTNPCKASTDDQHPDGELNPDNDAYATFTKTMLWVKVLGNGNKAEYYACEATNEFSVVTDTENLRTGVIFNVLTDGGADTNRYLTTKAWTTYTDKDGHTRLTAGYTAANTWICRLEEGTNLYYRAEGVALNAGTLVDSVDMAAEYCERHVQGEGDATWYVVYPYLSANDFARGRETTYAALAGKPVLERDEMDIRWLHYQVFQAKGFDPRTGWMYPPEGSVDSSSYTHMDEFMSMVFFHRGGTLTEDDMQVTPQHSREWIWGQYSTHPKRADTDSDQMPDGWELYLMAQVGDRGPRTNYSPLFPFSEISPNDRTARDPDLDMLQWPEEYSGVSSSGRYGWTPLQANWRNKTMPTNPWNEDTDGDGLKDGYEGGNGDNYYAGLAATYCFYNTAGRAGGGLNPLSVDTDGDGLPDPWELEFHGSYNATETATINTAIAGSTNTTSLIVGNRCTWNMDGMDPTVADARLDYDGDGLANWQEYMVGAMRCWRYDDCWNTWGVQTATFENLPEFGTPEWNKYWSDRLADTGNDNGNYNPNLVNGYFDSALYFTRCNNPWDGTGYNNYFYFKDGVDHNLDPLHPDNPVRHVQERTGEFVPGSDVAPNHYISCDPRVVDSDGDGMDDYYELFHGMNPLLGLPGATKMTLSAPFNACDLVHDAYARPINKTMGGASGAGPSALNNWWCNDDNPHIQPNIKHPELGGYDFIAYPWLNGIVGADPDGDNIVNQEEAILPSVQAAATYHHTDPTPLWMTDSSYTNSLTRKYYRNAPPTGDENTSVMVFDGAEATFDESNKTGVVTHKFTEYPGFTEDDGIVTFEYNNNPFSVAGGWMWPFEENEGYDSDHDYLSDYEEGQGKTKRASDPQVHDSPLRRQAMYFNGTDAFLQTPVAEEETIVGSRAATETRQNFLYYTVECWAKPDTESLAADNKIRTLVERAIYADNASAADEQLMRKNFLIGIKGGCWYTCFDSSGTDRQPVQINDGPQATTNWTHVAATFDGTALRLYVNGTCVNTHDTSVQPEHGVQALAVNKAGGLAGDTTFYPASCISILVGASAETLEGLVYDSAWRYRSYQYVNEENPFGLYTNATTIADYGNFYKGYIDEVRIWDGARAALDIKADYDNRTRYTFDLAETNRQEVFESWCLGGRRSPDSAIQLPPELMYHWAFDHIPGAVLTNDLAQVPAGFGTAAQVLNARARWSRPADYVERNWQSTAVRSTVYTDCAWVPWINNTVSHLPRFDLSTLDSVYWSADYAGYTKASAYGYERFGFPRNAEVYSRYRQQLYGATDYYDSHRDPFFDYYNGLTTTYLYLPASVQDRDTRWHAIAGFDASYAVDETVLRFRFASRNRLVCGDDILPMGGVYPRRISENEGGMWDDATASDAWAQTGPDADNNGLPDWWEEYARANYCPELDPRVPLEWDTPVDYNGLTLPAYEAYLRDLAKGLVKIGSDIGYRDEYSDKRDVDRDSIPDWWEDIYGVDTGSVADAKADPDHDDLSSLIEYLIATTPDFPALRANRMATDAAKGQLVPDYFLRHGSLYLGEMFADHDMIEDWWEDQQPVELTRGNERLANYSRFTYDANRDSDNDGWNNWQECRAEVYAGTRQELAYVKTNVIVRTIIGSAADLDTAYAEAVAQYGEANVTLNRSTATNEYASGSLLIHEGIDVSNTVPNYIGRPIPEVPIALAYNGNGSIKSLKGRKIVVKAWCQESAFDPDMNGEADAVWVLTADDTFPLNMTTNLVATTNGYLRSGRNMFVAYVANASSSGDSASGKNAAAASGIPDYVPGQPYGVAADVEVNYLRAAPMSIEMTDVHASIVRVDLKAALAAQAAGVGDMSVFINGTEDLEKVLGSVAQYFANPTNELSGVAAQYVAAVESGFEAVRATTDRGVTDHPFATVACPMTVGTNVTFATSNVLVRIYRSLVNGVSNIQYTDGAGIPRIYKMSSDEPMLERKLHIATHPQLTEADLYAAGLLDLDWGTVTSAYDDSGLSGLYGEDVVSAAYRIVIGDDTGSSWTNNNILAALIVNHYELGGSPTVASNLTYTAYGSQPTFFWTHENTIGKAYPAFRLIAKDGEAVIYDSGAMPAPARNGKGQYVFTAPIWPGMMTAAGVAVEADKDYTWQVSMLDAKFAEMPDDAASATFRIRNSGTLNDYGAIDVSVKYMGPGKVATSGVKDLLRVEAYLSPDFSGAPYGVGYVSYVNDEAGVNVLAADNRIEANARITGLLKGQTYYLKAFLDSDGDGRRAEWESWGYMNYVGTGSNEVYTARSVALEDGVRTSPCVIYVEDADTNNNQLPDVWEWNMDGCLGGPHTQGLTAKSPYIVTIDDQGAAAQSILWTVDNAGLSQLPYYAALAQPQGAPLLTTSSFALAMAGIDFSETEASSEVRITSFSLEDGICLEVVPSIVKDDEVVSVPKAVSIRVTLTLQLQRTDILGGVWENVGAPVVDTFTISESTMVQSSAALNDAIRAAADGNSSGYFRVAVSIGSEVID